MAHDTTVIIPNWNGLRWLPRCIEGLSQQTHRSFNTIVVDNASTDGSLEWLNTHAPHINVIANQSNLGFAPAVNQGIQATQTPLVALLNNDTIPQPEWLAALVDALESNPQTNLGSVASCMLHYDAPQTIENAGDLLTWEGEALKRGRNAPVTQFDTSREIISPCAGAALYTREFLKQTGGFDPHFFAYLEDVDLGLRGQILGYHCNYVPEAKILHMGHGSSIPSPTYTRLVTRNRYWLFWKNIPAELRRRHRSQLLFGASCFFAISRQPLLWLNAMRQAYRKKPEMLAFHKELWAKRRIEISYLDSLLEKSGTLSLRRPRKCPQRECNS